MSENLYIINGDEISIYATRPLRQYIIGRAKNVTKDILGYVACVGEVRVFALSLEEALRSIRFVLEDSNEIEVINRIQLTKKVTRKDLYLLIDMCDDGITKTMIENGLAPDTQEMGLGTVLALAEGKHNITYLKGLFL